MSDPINGAGAGKVRTFFGANGDALFKTIVTGFLALLGFFGVRTLNILDDTAKSVSSLEKGFAAYVVSLGNLGDRITRVEGKNDKQDGDINELQKRVWQMPAHLSPEQQQRQDWQRGR